jgi:hypothetical protein
VIINYGLFDSVSPTTSREKNRPFFENRKTECCSPRAGGNKIILGIFEGGEAANCLIWGGEAAKLFVAGENKYLGYENHISGCHVSTQTKKSLLGFFGRLRRPPSATDGFVVETDNLYSVKYTLHPTL